MNWLHSLQNDVRGARWLCWLVAALSVALGAWSTVAPPLPAPQVSSGTRPDAQQCAECHQQQHADFQRTPHARTLRKISDCDTILEFVRRQPDGEISFGSLVWRLADGKLSAALSSPSRSIPLDWAFGSGRHAITPVAVLQNPQGQTELLEHSVSWYASDELGATLGLGKSDEHNEPLGRWHSPAEAARCFGCHSTRVPQQQEQMRLDALLPTVQCDRCHQGSQEHAHLMQAGETATALSHWQSLTSEQAIGRCGECHRRTDEFTADELRPENKRLVRFAPVSLSLSPCFQAGRKLPAGDGRSLTCTRCHDPHQPASADAEFYRRRCLECHVDAAGQSKLCSVQPASSLCTTCHMPKVALNSWLSFTDHWIRVRD